MKRTCTAFVLCSSLATALPVKAETGFDENSWKFTGSAYLWAAGVEQTDAAGNQNEIKFSDVVGSLEGGLMGLIGAQKGRWTLLADAMYISIHEEASSNLDVKLKSYISTLGAAYRVANSDTASLDLMAGARYIKLDVDTELDVGVSKIKSSASDDSVDGIIGAQVTVDLSDSWILSLYADVGAGNSELTWQVWPGVRYRMGDLDLVAAYRYLAWETDNGDAIEDLSFKGPMLGVNYRF
jgi:opacity protein-like surface antigen